MSDSTDKNYAGRIILNCANCGGQLEVDRENDVAKCPYCGSTELLTESDEVVIERIKSKAMTEVASEKIQADKEVALTKLQIKVRGEIEKRLGKIRKSPVTVIIALLTIFFLFAAVDVYLERFLYSAIFAGCQTLLFFTAWLIRMRFVKGAGRRLHWLFTLLAVLLIIPFFYFIGEIYTSYEKYVWRSNKLSDMLPKPTLQYGEIKWDREDEFRITLGKASESDYIEYVDQCIRKGFVYDTSGYESSYGAFNETGEEVKVVRFAHINEIEITIYGHKDFYEYIWPDRWLSALVPVPEPKPGIIESDKEDYFRIVLSETTLTDYDKYVNACIDAGFSVNVSKSEDYFSANNAEGIRLHIMHNPGDIMEISVQPPIVYDE